MSHRAAEVVAEVVAAHLPGYRVGSVVRLGEGLDNVAYEVNGELIVRFGREPDPVRVDREARLLATVAAVAPLPVPVPAFTDPERGCLAYPKLPGTPLLDLPRPSGHEASIAAVLGDLLGALHAIPVAGLAGLVDADDPPPAEWQRDAADLYPTVAEVVPPPYRAPIEAFLAGPVPDGGHVPVFSHNDLGIEHVLVDPVRWTVTGIIDWSDAAIVDPAYDFGLLYRDLGPAALGTCRPDLRDRAVFYARCAVLEDLGYGLETGRDGYLAKSLDALRWLFPA